MNSTYSIDARRVCAMMGLYEMPRTHIAEWIKALGFKPSKDFVVENGQCFFTSSAAQKVYLAYKAGRDV